MTMLSSLELIRRVPLFSALTDAQAATLAQAVVKRRLRRGEKLVEQGHRSEAMFILLTGRARVVAVDGRGREVILATLQPGDPIGEMSLIDREPHSATVRAEVQTDVLELGREAFERCLPHPSSAAHALMQALVRRLRQADRRIESLALMGVHGRVARLLIDAATEDAAGRLLVRGRLSRQDMAKTVGASRERVSRVMKELEQRGFLEPLADGALWVRQPLSALGRG